MSIRSRIVGFSADVFRRGARERELSAELQSYLELLTDEKMHLGLTPAAARRAALLEIGGAEHAKERVRDARSTALFEPIARDLHIAWRGLRRHPGFAATVMLTLALGIGGTTGIFSVVNAVMYRELPGVVDPGQLVTFTRIQPTGTYANMSLPDYRDFRAASKNFSSVAAHTLSSMSVSVAGAAAERVRGDLVTGNYFGALGVNPETGRLLGEADDTAPGASPVVVISDAYWRRAFGADVNAVGGTLRVNGYPFRIVGVAMRGFGGTRTGFSTELWMPYAMQRQAMPRMSAGVLDDRAAGWINVFARLRPSVSIEQAEAENATISAQLAATYPLTNTGRRIGVVPGVGLSPDERDEVSGVLRLLLGAVVLVLFVACANAASLLLVRLVGRQREMATRLALGASRGRLAAQSLLEGAALALPAGLLGLGLAFLIAQLVKAAEPPGSLLHGIDAPLDGRVLAFAFAASMLSGLVAAVLPALHASRVMPMTAMKAGGRGFARGRSAVQDGLVAGQVALSFLALATAAMFFVGFFTLVNAPAGFEQKNAAMVSVDLAMQGYPAARGAVFQAEALRAVRAIPGVSAASISAGGARVSIFHPGEEPSPEVFHGREMELGTRVSLGVVTEGFFETLRIPLVTGRDFAAADRDGGPLVAIVNQELARRMWPGQPAVGQRIVWPPWSGPQRAPLEIIGVVADSKMGSLIEAVPPTLYVPLGQNYDGRNTIYVHSSNPASALRDVQRALARLDPGLPTYAAATMPEYLAAGLWQQRMAAQWIIAFGVTALVLCVLGLYGVVAHSVAGRAGELSVRLALGATTGGVTRLVLRDGVRVALAGLAIGTIAFALTGRATARLVDGVQTVGPAVPALLALILSAVMLLACYLPARRAARMNPVDALRGD